MSTRAITAAPCAKCPFRKDVPIYLRRGRRAEIARALLTGGDFACHATVDYNTGEDEDGVAVVDTSGSSMCAGAAKALLQDGTTSNWMRVAERLGMADLDRTAERGPDVWGMTEWQTLPEGATASNPEGDEEDDEPEGETCGTVNAGCLAPAGYATGGGIVYGTEVADGACTLCGEALCSNCADSQGRCGMCSEDELDGLDDDEEQEP